MTGKRAVRVAAAIMIGVLLLTVNPAPGFAAPLWEW